ncbi:MAG TPA: sigma-70 family RNA polymerase sigma factor [Candidatus Binataceae bacterium]|nr:sigma-70 family RNA polymerase sigma factor [Candidatus Binataceae bacterium]
MLDPHKDVDFEHVFLPHLDSAYNLARWLMRNDADAQDVVQEAYLRALRFAHGYRGGDARAWLLAIVRNTALTWIQRNRRSNEAAEFDEEAHGTCSGADSLEAAMVRDAEGKAIRAALEALPIEYREVIVMREIEGLTYKEIADAAELPIGTVMSRLARARKRLQNALASLVGRKVTQ